MSVSLNSAVHQSLDDLLALAPNWDGFGAPLIDRNTVVAARKLVDALPAIVANTPHVAPTSSGNLQFEWHAGEISLELEFENPQTIHYLKWHPAKSVEDEEVFPALDVDKAASLLKWFEEEKAAWQQNGHVGR